MELVFGVLIGVIGVSVGIVGVALFLVTGNLAAQIQVLRDEAGKREDRIVFLEKRKTVIAEAVAGQPKPAGVGAVHSATRIRTWDQDAPYVEKASH